MFKNSILVADLLKSNRHISKLMHGGKCIYQPLQEYKEEEPPEPEPSQDYFHFEALSDGAKVKIPAAFQYSTDKVTWTQGTGGQLTLNAGDKVYYKANSTAAKENVFSSMTTGTIAVRGNIMSLIYGDDFSGKTTLPNTNYLFRGMFRKSTSITTAEELVMPATVLRTGCYASIFENCSNLTISPTLPALTLTGGCYEYMFKNCSKLKVVRAMVLTDIVSNTNDTNGWLYGVATTGTFYRNKNATWDATVRYSSGSTVPPNWTVRSTL